MIERDTYETGSGDSGWESSTGYVLTAGGYQGSTGEGGYQSGVGAH